MSSTFSRERLSMVEHQLRQRGIHDERVLAAMNRVPRHEFVLPQDWPEAYSDRPIGIAEQQTTSQPYMIAAMLQAAEISPEDRILEIGAGSGYQTALLAELAREIFAIDRYPTLVEQARQALDRLGYTKITLVAGDGTLGLPPFAPFNAIIVSAAAPQPPPALIEQLAVGGRLVVPVGDASQQVLEVVEKQPDGITVRSLEGCRFVPLIGQQGFAA